MSNSDLYESCLAVRPQLGVGVPMEDLCLGHALQNLVYQTPVYKMPAYAEQTPCPQAPPAFPIEWLKEISAAIARGVEDGRRAELAFTPEMREGRVDDVIADILAGRVSRRQLERVKDVTSRALQDKAVGDAFRPR